MVWPFLSALAYFTAPRSSQVLEGRIITTLSKRMGRLFREALARRVSCTVPLSDLIWFNQARASTGSK